MTKLCPAPIAKAFCWASAISASSVPLQRTRRSPDASQNASPKRMPGTALYSASCRSSTDLMKCAWPRMMLADSGFMIGTIVISMISPLGMCENRLSRSVQVQLGALRARGQACSAFLLHLNLLADMVCHCGQRCHFATRPLEQHRYVRPTDDLVGDAAEKHARQTAPAVRGQRDQIGSVLARVVDDRHCRWRDCDIYGYHRDARANTRRDSFEIGSRLGAPLLQHPLVEHGRLRGRRISQHR